MRNKKRGGVFLTFTTILCLIISLMISGCSTTGSSKKSVASDSKAEIPFSTDWNKAIKSGDVVMISDSKSEVYNIQNLDDFIKNYSSRPNKRISIIKFFRENDKLQLNKASTLEYIDNKLYLISYDPYDNFKSEKLQIDKLESTSSNDGIRYAYTINNDKNNAATLISFSKDSIK